MEKDMFSVTPVEQRIFLEPGQLYEGTITVANPVEATDDFSYKVSVLPFSVVGEDYQTNLAERTNRTQMVDWIKLDKESGTLKPNETNKINYTITVPIEVPGGAQFAAITVTEDKPSSEGSGAVIENVCEIASVIYAEVAGETVHEGKVLENNVPGFVNAVPVQVSAVMDNNGNVFEESIVALKVRNAITGEEILPKGDNKGQYNELIMPETTRRVERDVEDLPILGMVYIEQTIYYNGQVSTVGRNVIICPIWFIILVLGVILGIAGLIVRLVIKRRKKKAKYNF